MTRSARKTCFALAAASLLAAACASNTPPADDTSAAPASASGTPAARTGPAATKNQPGQRAGSQAGAQPNVKGVPAQRSVYYDFDRAEIKSEFRPAIEAHARYLRENADARVTIEGNGDERGSREYNLALGQKRAEAVQKMMRLSGAADGQIEAVSFGEEKPKALGHDEASWAENRRSDVVYQRGK
jgi:peptidoglycan-associated lipoprotein